MRLNGVGLTCAVEPNELLVQHLREAHSLFGAKVGCDSSNCGACTVLVDNLPVRSCSLLAVQAEGRDVLTIEGLASDGVANRIAEELVERCGIQCGFCTPGIVIVSTWLLKSGEPVTEASVRAALDGNLCRCTGYHNIVASILALAGFER